MIAGWPAAAVCFACGGRAVRVVRSEASLYEYDIVGVGGPDQVLLADTPGQSGELTDSEAVGLVCAEGHHWPFSNAVDYEWADGSDPAHVVALDNWRAFYGDPLVSDEERAGD